MAEGALPKGFEKPSGSSSQSSASPKKRGADKLGISIAIGITAVALILGIGLTGVIPMDLGLPSVMQPATTAPVPQEPYWNFFVPTQSSGSYAPSDGNLIDQLDWSISTGDVVAMYLDKGSSSLIIHTDTVDDGELFVGLNADYIGSDDGTFFILVDNQEHEDYEQAGMDLYINLPAGAETVEIFGDYIVY
ncbi:MAG: hypothetical protein COB95_05520 [Nitrosopumilales archaeon]|jgi:hypothetical protein|nr:MAG: hypothetical protein COB95_05520 [Nitrosopumilales archaeon]